MFSTVSAACGAQRRNVAALQGLLAACDLSDVCTWTVRAEVVEGQLSPVYSDVEARDRLEELARLLAGGRVVACRASTDDHTVVEALGTAGDVSFRFWTHVGHAEGYGQRGR